MRSSPPPVKQEYANAKRLDWEMLKVWSSLGMLRLIYLDESGSCCQSPTEYSYARSGVQKRIGQRKRRGRRINIWAVLEQKVRFDYALMLGTLKTSTHLQLMEWQAQKAWQHLQQTGQITVMMLDNASVHQSHLVRSRIDDWQQQGLYLFFLPPYSPQLNRIEDEWLHLKRDELSGQVFDDEYDLACAIIAGVESRATHHGYVVERFRFN